MEKNKENLGILYRNERQAIIDNLKVGLTITQACKLAKVSPERFYQEMKKDGAFAQDVDAVEVEPIKRNWTVIQRAATSGDWHAAAWSLEHKYPKQFAIATKVEHSGPGGGPIQIETADLSGFTKDELMGISKIDFAGTKALNGNHRDTADK